MKLTLHNLVTTLLITTITIPYINYLINNKIPFIKNTHNITNINLILNTATYLILKTNTPFNQLNKIKTTITIISLILKLITLTFTKTTTTKILLTIFIKSIFII